MWIFDYFSYICIAFFLILGLVRILRKNKREVYTEEMCKKIPDKKIVILVRKINKSILFFGFLSIFLSFSIMLSTFVFKHFENGYLNTICSILIVVGVVISFIPTRHVNSSYSSSLMMLRDEIFDYYKEYNFKSIYEWHNSKKFNSSDITQKECMFLLKTYPIFFYIIFTGKIIFYVGAFCICLF